MKKLRYLSLLLAAFVFLSGCAEEPSGQVFEHTFFIMGTVCDIKVISQGSKEAQDILQRLYGSLKDTEAQYDFYDGKSRISEINTDASRGSAVLSEDEAAVIKRALELSALTQGAFDITFTPLWDLWKQCEKEGRLPADDEINIAKKNVGYRKISLSPDGRIIKFSSKDIRINLGGIAKGIALLNCKDVAEKIGADNIMVNLGGDILALGRGRGDGWVVAIQDPFDPDKTAKKMHVRDKIVLTSGVYQRYVTIRGKKYHHIIDANTGFPAGDFSSVTLVLDADRKEYVPSLAVFLMGRKKALDYLNKNRRIEHFILGYDGAIIR